MFLVIATSIFGKRSQNSSRESFGPFHNVEVRGKYLICDNKLIAKFYEIDKRYSDFVQQKCGWYFRGQPYDSFSVLEFDSELTGTRSD